VLRPPGLPDAEWGALADAMDIAQDFGFGTESDYRSWEDRLREQLAQIPGVEPLPVRWLALFALVYLLVIGPVDYLLLRLVGRQPLTWLTFPTYIAAFSAFALVGTAKIKGDQAVLVRYEVVDVLPGADRWRGESLVGVFATGRSQVSLTSGFDDAAVEPLELPGSLWDPAVSSSEGPMRLDYRAETWTLAYARSAWSGPWRGGVRASRSGDRLVLRSDLPFPLDDVRVDFLDQSSAWVGRLEPGVDAEVVLQDSTAGFVEPGSAMDLLRRYPERHRGHLRPLPGHPVLAGLAAEPVEPLVVGGLAPSIRSQTVVRVPLTLVETP
jgi:hypothetical protein